jgi:two-component system, NarL family, sensor histidine kinase UhpB
MTTPDPHALAAADGSATDGDQRARRRYVPLLHRVVGVNVALVIVAVGVTILVLVPGRESSFRLNEEGIVLGLAVAAVVLLNLYLLRRVVRPVQELTVVARTVDLSDPHPPLPDARPNSEAGELALTFNEMLIRLRAERREATGRVLAAQEAERLRISQELHDQVGQELTAVLLLLSRVQSRAPEELRSAVMDAQDTVRASLEDVRQIALQLRPEALDDLGLESALAVLCDRFAERSGLEVSYELDDATPPLPAETELVIYRVTQEALTNVARHSGSRTARLTMGPEDGQIVVTVRDQGRGIDPARGAGGGIRGMRERAALIGGKLQIHNLDGGGCEVSLRVPVELAT